MKPRMTECLDDSAATLRRPGSAFTNGPAGHEFVREWMTKGKLPGKTGVQMPGEGNPWSHLKSSSQKLKNQGDSGKKTATVG